MALSGSERTRAIEEVIAALDRRMPRVERAGEAAIARDAAALRARALERLSELATHPATRPHSGFSIRAEEIATHHAHPVPGHAV